MQQVGTGRDPVTLVAFLAMVAGIAGNITAVKYIARAGDLDPMWAAASRFVLAALIFAVAALVIHAPMPRGRALVGAVLYGALAFGGFFAFVYWGLQEAPVGLAGVFLATGPLLTFLFALAHRQERFRWDSMIGAAIVVLGTAVVFRAGVGEGTPVASLLAILAASACAAEGAVVVKAFPQVHPASRNAIGVAVGAGMLLVLMPFFGESYAIPEETSTWVSQVYLITFGTVGVFGLYLFVLSRWSASATSYEFVLAPVAGIALAAWLFDERVTAGFVIGSILVLIGVYLGALRPASSAPTEGAIDDRERVDLTSEVRPTLQRLDMLIAGELRAKIDAAVAAARDMLTQSQEPFGWHFIDLPTDVPDGIRSGGVFVLPGGTAPPAHRHPNSIQHMRVLSGQATVVLRSAEDEAVHDQVGIGEQRPWLVIPRDVVHGFELSSDQDLVVLSFHTVPQSELLEVGAAGERTYLGPDDPR